MPTPFILRLLFGAGLIASGLRVFHQLKILRRAEQPIQVLYAWSERPLSSWRYEPHTATSILIHTLGVSVLSLIALGAAGNPTSFDNPLITNDQTMVFLVWIAAGGSIALVGYLLGSMLAFPLTRLWQPPISMAITDQGMLHGSSLMPWGWFSHFSVDPNSGLLRLYSAFAPDLPSLVSKPPASEGLDEIGKALQDYLPSQPANPSRAWYRSKYWLIPTIILVCLPLVGTGYIAHYLPRELALFGMAASSAVLFLLGGRIITLFGFGILSIREEHPDPHPPT
jgi:hypothetical protein